MYFPAHIQENRDENATTCHLALDRGVLSPRTRCGVQEVNEWEMTPACILICRYFLDSASRCGMTESPRRGAECPSPSPRTTMRGPGGGWSHHSPNRRRALAVVAASTSAAVTPRISAMRRAMRGRYDGSLRLPR